MDSDRTLFFKQVFHGTMIILIGCAISYFINVRYLGILTMSDWFVYGLIGLVVFGVIVAILWPKKKKKAPLTYPGIQPMKVWSAHEFGEKQVPAKPYVPVYPSDSTLSDFKPTALYSPPHHVSYEDGNHRDDSSFLTSMLVAEATDSPVLGVLAGRSLTGSIVGSTLAHHHDSSSSSSSIVDAPSIPTVQSDSDSSGVSSGSSSNSIDFGSSDSWSSSSSDSGSSFSDSGSSSFSDSGSSSFSSDSF